MMLNLNYLVIISRLFKKFIIFYEKKVGVAVLHSTRYDNSKGNRIGPSLFYASELHSKYNKKRAGFETCSLIIY